MDPKRLQKHKLNNLIHSALIMTGLIRSLDLRELIGVLAHESFGIPMGMVPIQRKPRWRIGGLWY